MTLWSSSPRSREDIIDDVAAGLPLPGYVMVTMLYWCSFLLCSLFVR